MIDIYDIVRPGDRVDVESVPLNASKEVAQDEEKKYYITKVYDITDEDEELVEIIMPSEKTKMIVLSMDALYDLYFYAGKGIYTCSARVIDRRNEGNVAIAVLRPESELVRHQRREYYRYSCILSMSTRMLKDYEEVSYIDSSHYDESIEPSDKSTIVDISGGGIRFVSSAKYPTDHLVNCRFSLQFRGRVSRYDCVVRILSGDVVANNMFQTEYRGQFVHIDGGAREEIIRYIFEEERKVRARQSGSGMGI